MRRPSSASQQFTAMCPRLSPTIPLVFLLIFGGIARPEAASGKDAGASPGGNHELAAGDRSAAPAFNLPGAHGPVVLDSLRGKVVVVDFWASWCGPCAESFSWLNGLQQRYGPHGLVVVGINLDKSRGPVDAFLDAHHASFTIAYDPLGRTAQAYQIPGMPTTVVIGRDGRILKVHAGFNPKKTEQIEQVVKEACAS